MAKKSQARSSEFLSCLEGLRMLNLIDEHTRECLLARPERRRSSAKVIEELADVM